MGISFRRVPVWEPGEGGFIYRELQEIVKGGSRNGASLSMGALLGEPGGWAPLLGTLKDM